MRPKQIELPLLEDLPQTICAACGKSKINGLFSPAQFRKKDGSLPRCMLCTEEINAAKKSRAGQSAHFNPRAASAKL
jgi:hypothetical protein